MRYDGKFDIRIGDVFTDSSNPGAYAVVISPDRAAYLMFNNGVWRTAGDISIFPDRFNVSTLVDAGRRVVYMGVRKYRDGSLTGRYHYLVETADGKFIYGAGCRTFRSLEAALKHWEPSVKGTFRAEKRRMVMAAYKQAYKNGWITAKEAGVPVAPSFRKKKKAKR